MSKITHVLNNVGPNGQSVRPPPRDGTSDEYQHAYDGQDTFCEQRSCTGLYGFDPQNMTTYHHDDSGRMWVPAMKAEEWPAMATYHHHATPPPQQCMSLPAAQQPHRACFMPAGQQTPPEPSMPAHSSITASYPYMVAQYAAPYQQPPSPYGTLCHQQPLLPHCSQWGPAQQPLLYSHQPYHLQQPLPYQPHYQPVTAVDPRVYQQSTFITNAPLGPAPYPHMAAPAATYYPAAPMHPYPAAQMYPAPAWGNAA